METAYHAPGVRGKQEWRKSVNHIRRRALPGFKSHATQRVEEQNTWGERKGFVIGDTHMKTGIKKAAAQPKFIVAVAIAILALETAPANAGLIVAEDFGGSGVALNGTSADTFDAGIVAKGGSSNWTANAAFLDNGFVTLATRVGAYLNLGSYIDDAAGTAGEVRPHHAHSANDRHMALARFRDKQDAEHHEGFHQYRLGRGSDGWNRDDHLPLRDRQPRR